jgi:hypothetical protein
MPAPGTFVLHSQAVPPLPAGDYTLQGTQEVAGGPTAPYSGSLRVTSARYRMPPDQILSTFPPANAEGAFESRLPQIVIKRRTLPWERVMDPAHREIPWMALVVIAEGEGQVSGESPVSDCVTPGVNLAGPNDVATGFYLTVSQTVVNAVFPTSDDLQLLTHMREVDLSDTELALGDDDGFLAVMLANRLPQYDRVNCQPVRYMACLISLEGQLDALPPEPPEFIFNFNALAYVQDVRPEAALLNQSADQVAMGPVALGTQATASKSVTPNAAVQAHAAQAPRKVIADSWKIAQTSVNEIAVSAAPAEAGRLVRDQMTANFRLPIDQLVLEKTYRFPLLAHWSFTCTGACSFQSLLEGLDVGLLGTLPADPLAPPKPDCAPVNNGSAPPPVPPPRPAPEATETGHIGLHNLTCRGDSLRAWYRGPLTLHVTEREQPDADGRLPLAHTSDQLRRVTPDGREDLSLAAAFEIGRLLAFSQPSVMSALIRWRGEQFGAERARLLAAEAVGSSVLLNPALDGSVEQLGRLAGRQIVTGAAQAPDKVLAPNRPLTDPGRPIPYLTGDVDQIVANGFNLPLADVRKLMSTVGPVAALNQTVVQAVLTPAPDATSTVHLRASLSNIVDQLTSNSSLKTPVAGGVRTNLEGEGEAPDALDQLIEAAAQTRMGKL